MADERRKEAVIIERRASPLADCGMFSFFIELTSNRNVQVTSGEAAVLGMGHIFTNV